MLLTFSDDPSAPLGSMRTVQNRWFPGGRVREAKAAAFSAQKRAGEDRPTSGQRERAGKRRRFRA
jgi:hypothetical protein